MNFLKDMAAWARGNESQDTQRSIKTPSYDIEEARKNVFDLLNGRNEISPESMSAKDQDSLKEAMEEYLVKYAKGGYMAADFMDCYRSHEVPDSLDEIIRYLGYVREDDKGKRINNQLARFASLVRGKKPLIIGGVDHEEYGVPTMFFIGKDGKGYKTENQARTLGGGLVREEVFYVKDGKPTNRPPSKEAVEEARRRASSSPGA